MIEVWVAFIAFILLLLALDLGLFHRKAHVVAPKEALGWVGVWVGLGVAFTLFIYFAYERQWFGLGTSPDPVDGAMNDGGDAALKYLTGYLVEESLSVDNIFAIAMILRFLAVPAIYQHRVLFWGIVGALVMRGCMIGVGATLVARFHWVLYLFGLFLVFTGIKMLLVKGTHGDVGRGVVQRVARRLLPVTDRFHGQHFLVRAGSPESRAGEVPGSAPAPDEAAESARPGALMMTPLALALVLVETTDLVFAVDSIPAIFAITADPFLVFTSNVFAILGLRSLYFALAGIMDKFRYLKTALSLVLVVVGAKMLAAEWLKAWLGEHFNLGLLGIVLLILAVGVVASLRPGAAPQPARPADAQGSPETHSAPRGTGASGAKAHSARRKRSTTSTR